MTPFVFDDVILSLCWQIERRLNAVGKDISFLVQPVEFIDALKKELKSAFKNYKDFIVQ